MVWYGIGKNSGVAEGESATFSLLSLANASIAKFVVQMYPLLYPQMIGLDKLISNYD